MAGSILYRCETCYGSGVRNAEDVILHEIFELRNTDILCYCLDKYGLTRMGFNRTLESLIKATDNGDELDEEEIRLVVKDLLKHIEAITGHAVRFALWLTTKQAAKELYEGTEESLDAYHTGPVILSDLGEDGILFGYESNPEKI